MDFPHYSFLILTLFHVNSHAVDLNGGDNTSSSRLPFQALGCVEISSDLFNPLFENEPWESQELEKTTPDLPNACAKVCNMASRGSGNYTYFALDYNPETQANCYCLNQDHVLQHITIDLQNCWRSCAVRPCLKVVQLYSACPYGFWGPPLCEAPCPAYCQHLQSRTATQCFANGSCIGGCQTESGHCFYTKVTSTIESGLFHLIKNGEMSVSKHKPALSVFSGSLQAQKPGYVNTVSAFMSPIGWCYIGFWEIGKQTDRDQFQISLSGKSQLKAEFPGLYTKHLLSKNKIFLQKGHAIGIHFSQDLLFRAEAKTIDIHDYTAIYATEDKNLGADIYMMTNAFDPGTSDNDGWANGKTLDNVKFYSEEFGHKFNFYTAAISVSLASPCPENCRKAMCTIDLTCSFGCNPGFLGALCDQVCPPRTFGFRCVHTCSKACANEVCDALSGRCTLGCKQNFKGAFCSEPICPTGQVCKIHCSKYCRSGICDLKSGECVDGCLPGFQMPLCNEKCLSGTFGLGCKQQCGECAGGSPCDAVTGECTQGCAYGKAPPTCICDLGKFLERGDCSEDCGACQGNKKCYDDGTCPKNVCQPGFEPPTCKCPLHTFRPPSCNRTCGSCDMCHHADGRCLVPCKPGWFGKHCDLVCRPGTFGAGCSQPCGNCRERACDPETGKCEHCQLGFTGSKCIHCAEGRYGERCQFVCGNCAKNELCSHDTGQCSACDADYQMPMCICTQEKCSSLTCPRGFFGPDCRTPCSRYCLEDLCTNPDGRCLLGCEAGFVEPFCLCLQGHYGKECRKCGHCEGPCDGDTGTCLQCKDGYKMPHCRCTQGEWGHSCQHRCGHCLEDTDCDSVTGACPSGCQPGLLPPSCSQPCMAGRYGDQCESECGHCLDGGRCDVLTGKCPGACEAGYVQPFCKEGCPEHHHGPNCEGVCGHCFNANPCLNDSTCLGGCIKGYLPPYCLEVCPPGFFGYFCESECGSCSNREPCHYQTGECIFGCADGYTGTLCTINVRQGHVEAPQCKDGEYGEDCSGRCGFCEGGLPCDALNGVCPDNCELGYETPFCKKVCSHGFYGMNCESVCGNCAKVSDCNVLNGKCARGCSSGFYGPQCNFDSIEAYKSYTFSEGMRELNMYSGQETIKCTLVHLYIICASIISSLSLLW